MFEEEDKPTMALGAAFAAATLAFAAAYALGKFLLRDAVLAFGIAVAISLLAMRVVFVRASA